MTEVLRYQLDDGSAALFEVADDGSGLQRASRATDGVLEAGSRLQEALESVRSAARASLETLMTLSPSGVELEFGVKLTAETGAIIARTAAEGHFVVKVKWATEGEPAAD